jgi:hypothetical protein
VVQRERKMSNYPKIENVWQGEASWISHVPHGVEVSVEEKLDGSQISFGKTQDGMFYINSKRRKLYQCNAAGAEAEFPVPAGFQMAVDSLVGRRNLVMPGAHFVGEAITKRRHNKIKYGRIPPSGVVVFACAVDGEYLKDYRSVVDIVLKFETAREIERLPGWTRIDDAQLSGYLSQESMLGGSTIEGVVLKPWVGDHPVRHLSMVKYVSPEFREANKTRSIRPRNATVDSLIDFYRTPGRWAKVIEQCKDEGVLDGAMNDMPHLLRHMNEEFEIEEADTVASTLYKAHRKDIMKGLARGFADYYREYLIGGSGLSVSHDERGDINVG